MKLSGIYLIQCNKNNKSYIGASGNIKIRWREHKNKSALGKHDNKLLENDIKEFGIQSFGFSILEFCSKEDFNEKEKYWIEKYNSTNSEKGYNILLPGGYVPKSVGSNRIKKNDIDYSKSASKRGRKFLSIIQINLASGEHKETNSAEIIKDLDIKYCKLFKCLSYWDNKNNSTKSYKGYIFIRKSQYNENYDYINHKKEPVFKLKKSKPKKPSVYETKTRRELATNKIEIILQDIQTKDCIEVSCIMEAVEKYKMNRAKIYKLLKNDFGKYQHKGYFIKYKEGTGIV